MRFRRNPVACILPVGPEHPVDVPLLVLKGVQRLQDGRLRDEVLALSGEARLADGGGQIDGAGIAPARRLHGVHEMVLDLVQLELNLVPELGKFLFCKPPSYSFNNNFSVLI